MAKDVSETQKQTNAVTKKQKKSHGGLIFSIIILLIVLLLAGSGYYLLQEIDTKQVAQNDAMRKSSLREIELSKQLNAFQAQIVTMQAQIATSNDAIVGKNNDYSNRLAEFSRTHTDRLDHAHKKLTDEMTALKRQLGKTRGDWLMADAEYLLSIASQRLQLVGDVNTAKMALEAANQRLRESGDGSAIKIREQIVKEIASLETVSLPDVVGMYAKIQLLKDKVVNLAILLPYAGKPLTESTQIHSHQQTEDANHDVLDSTLGFLNKYLTVRHSDQPVNEILTLEDVAFIRQQLNIKLEMIKIALVQQNEALYETSIDDAKQWINKNFTRNDEVKSFLVALDKLNLIQLYSQFPDISQSLKMLKDIIKLHIETDKTMVTP